MKFGLTKIMNQKKDIFLIFLLNYNSQNTKTTLKSKSS